MTLPHFESNQLASQMSESFSAQMMEPQRFMTEELQRINRRFGAAGMIEASDEKTDRVLLQLFERGIPKDFRDLRLCVQAMGVFVDVDEEAWSPFTDPEIFDQLIAEVEDQSRSQSKQRLLAQATLYSYLTINGTFKDEGSPERKHWRRLGEVLRRFAAGARSGDRLAEALKRHEPLLGDRPAQFYAESLLDENDDSLDLMARELSIPDDSWFWVRLILEQVKTLDRLPEGEFTETWPKLLERVRAHEAIADEGLAGIMDAFALRESRSRSAAQPLIDMAGERWDNPLVRPTGWLAWVSKETLNVFRPWVSEGMIDTFFRFLAEDRGVSQERPRFWKQYSEHITEIRILVASDFNTFTNEELAALRSQMGRTHFRKLETEGTHVFIMKIGKYQFCEISKHGNAAFFHGDEFVKHLFESPGSISLTKIKHSVAVSELRHVMKTPRNKWTHQGNWQRNFAERINLLTRARPKKNRGRR